MSNEYILVVRIEAKKKFKNEVKEALKSILEPTRKEEGCLLYELHQDEKNSHKFLFYEIWETFDHWKKHDQSPHIIEHNKKTKNMINNIKFHTLNKL